MAVNKRKIEPTTACGLGKTLKLGFNRFNEGGKINEIKNPRVNELFSEGTTVFGTPFIKPHFLTFCNYDIGIKRSNNY